MAALFGQIKEFDEEKEQWTQYVERLGHFFMANDVESPERKRAILLTVMGPKCYKLLRSLIAPSEPNDRTYKELVDALQEHHDPTPSETVQRFLFNSRVRQPGSPFQHMCLNCEHYRTTLQLRFFTRRYVARLPSVWYS